MDLIYQFSKFLTNHLTNDFSRFASFHKDQHLEVCFHQCHLFITRIADGPTTLSNILSCSDTQARARFFWYVPICHTDFKYAPQSWRSLCKCCAGLHSLFPVATSKRHVFRQQEHRTHLSLPCRLLSASSRAPAHIKKEILTRKFTSVSFNTLNKLFVKRKKGERLQDWTSRYLHQQTGRVSIYWLLSLAQA